jgi:hypothetical protein
MHDLHGTRTDPKKVHSVIDLDYWRGEIVLAPGERLHDTWIASPRQLLHMERRRAEAFATLAKPPAGVAIDLFLWGFGFGTRERPYLTQVGGTPWREAAKPWPKDKSGKPLTFIAQLCFVDSHDVVVGPLPGDVLLIFAHYADGNLTLDHESLALEWSAIELQKPLDSLNVPRGSGLPFRFDGAIHRTHQYPGAEALFGPKSIHDAEWQGTIIGPSAFMPQGGSTDGLIATFSSLLPYDAEWPLLNVPALPTCVMPRGTASRSSHGS